MVLTATEISARIRAGEEIKLEDVDVVTTATRGIMSGTYAVFSFKVSEPDSFVKASEVLLNGVPAIVGPCPNERLGVLDLIVLGTAHSESNPNYGGGHLFREMVEGKTIKVDVTTSERDRFSVETRLSEIPYAKLHATRHAFKNYRAFVNPGKEPIKTIFHALPFEGEFKEMTFCGCGELNPIENDPELETIGIGTRVLLNGADGFVTGAGTRSAPDNPNLTGFADMHDMTPEYMGGFATSAGPERVRHQALRAAGVDEPHPRSPAPRSGGQTPARTPGPIRRAGPGNRADPSAGLAAAGSARPDHATHGWLGSPWRAGTVGVAP